jgi:sulfate adenylyltransferase large subunit
MRSRTSEKRGLEAVDLSLLTDGLQAEREQGITIDVAYRYFSTGRRKYIIADAPGHEQYTRNMVTAASTADLAIILIDARKGVLTQTRRHSYLAHLLDIPHLVVAVNKMDLVDYDQATFERIRKDYLDFAARLGIGDVRFIPLSALNGDMLVERGERLDWYTGPTLLDVLENAPTAHAGRDEGFRFPVQYVCRPHASADRKLHDFRGFMGRVASGEIAAGEEVTVLPSGQRSRIKDIQLGGRSLATARAEQSVTLLLEDEIDISRGDMVVRAADSNLGAGMRGVVDLRQVLKIQMRIDLRRGDAGVAEHFLHRAQVAGGLQHMAGKRVAQHVRMDMDADALALRPLREAAFDLARRQPGAVAAEEQRRLLAAQQLRAHRQPRLQRGARLVADRHGARLAPLAGDGDFALPRGRGRRASRG